MDTLLAATRRWIASVKPVPGVLKSDATASLPVAVAAVPDGMATAALIGVNPIHGLYAMVFGPIVGGLATVTSRMALAVTGASALAAGSALDHVSEGDRTAALFLLTVVTGLFMLAAGLARLGRYTRFVSHSVMVGFLTGVSVSMILGQVPKLTGTTSDAATPLTRFLDIVTGPGRHRRADARRRRCHHRARWWRSAAPGSGRSPPSSPSPCRPWWWSCSTPPASPRSPTPGPSRSGCRSPTYPTSGCSTSTSCRGPPPSP